MKDQFKKKFSTDLSESLLATLSRYFPPIEFNEALIDVVNVLMDGLSRGDIYIDMKEIPKNLELKYKGWPSFHMKVLLESGWTKGDNSPIVLNENLISWRRTHNEIVETIHKILVRNKPINIISKELPIWELKSMNLWNEEQLTIPNYNLSKSSDMPNHIHSLN